MSRRWYAAFAGVLLVAAAAGGAVLVGTGGDDTKPAATNDAPTTTVRSGDLRQAQEVPGALGFGTPTTVTGSGEGVITWLPSAGVKVTRGQQLYRVDDAPVSLFYGGLPLYRTLSDHALDGGGDTAGDTGDGTGDGTGENQPDGPGKGGGEGGDEQKKPAYVLPTGHDVDLVAQNLAALGYYDGSTVDARYDWTLAHAVEEWQDDQGVEATGVLDPARIVVRTGPVRVDTVTAQTGGPAAQDVLTVTSTSRIITLQAPVEVAQGLRPGVRLRVSLPDGTRVATKVEHIGTAAKEGEDGGPPSVPVTVVPVKDGALAKATLGPVTARVVTAERRDVLSVPVTALLSLAGGGYAVQRPDDSLVPVTIGMVAGGRVEVSGIEAGATVVVAP